MHRTHQGGAAGLGHAAERVDLVDLHARLNQRPHELGLIDLAVGVLIESVEPLGRLLVDVGDRAAHVEHGRAHELGHQLGPVDGFGERGQQPRATLGAENVARDAATTLRIERRPFGLETRGEGVHVEWQLREQRLRQPRLTDQPLALVVHAGEPGVGLGLHRGHTLDLVEVGAAHRAALMRQVTAALQVEEV